ISCLFVPFAYGYEDFSHARINSSDDIWDMMEDGEISSEYAQFLLGLYDDPLMITSVSKEDLNDLSILSPEEIEIFLEYQRNLAIPQQETATMSNDIFETIKPFLNQYPGQNRLRLTHSSHLHGQTAESLKITLNPKTQVYLWNKDTHNDSLSKYCLEFHDCAVGYYFLRFGEGLVLNNGSYMSGSGTFHDTLWRKSKVMRGAYLAKPFNRIQSGLFFSDITSQPYTLSLKGFDRERLVGCHTKLQLKGLSVGYTGYSSKLEAAQATDTTYSVIGPYLVIDSPVLQISGESAWYHGTNTNGYGWIVKMERAKTPARGAALARGATSSIKCFVYDFDKNFCSPYGHISGIGKMQDTSGGSVQISRFFNSRLSNIKASYDYSRDNNYRLWIMACYKPSKKIRTKWWIENASDEKTAYTGRIFWDITHSLYTTLGLRHEKQDDKNGGYVFLESTYSPHPATAIKARIKFQDNMIRNDYKEYNLQLVQQALKQHIKIIGKYSLKEYQDNTHDCRTNLEIETRW
ncbi:MAG: hypothetical protein ABH870_08035, partial [bacterium]